MKPGNIFLDSSDHVKIGDFGLATAVSLKGTNTVVNTTEKLSHTNTEKIATGNSNLTGHVGTTFYIAPEVSAKQGKMTYSNKVDIYSLGIIFFEMNVRLVWGMERVKILSALRLPQICFPQDADKQLDEEKRQMVEWLLNHDASKRPSAGELLKSSLVPPPTEEKQKFMTTLETKIQNERSQDYQDILNLLFKPNLDRPQLEAAFELDVPKLTKKQLLAYNMVRSLVTTIFKDHGGLWIPLPFYVPRGCFYQDKENSVSLMSKGGELITATYELRYPLARFVSRNEVKLLKRYSIDRVQRAAKLSGLHPTEVYECAFDIIAPKHDWSESCGRVALIAQQILDKMPIWFSNEEKDRKTSNQVPR